MDNYADEIRSSVPAMELFPFYGFELNRAGFCHSPFADSDSTPSLKVYPGDRGWHDFSSGKGGDVIDFVREFFGLSFIDAQKKISNDFGLGYPIGEPMTKEQRAEAERKALERKKRQEERKKAHEMVYSTYKRALHRWIYLDSLKRKFAPKSPEDSLRQEFVYAINMMDEANYKFDVAAEKLWEFEQNN